MYKFAMLFLVKVLFVNFKAPAKVCLYLQEIDEWMEKEKNE